MLNIKKVILLIGDLTCFYLALGLTLLIRYSYDIELWLRHFWPFTIIYLLWVIVFYIAGLYELTLARNNLDFYSLLLEAFIVNATIAVAFFYFIPYYGITPKTNLFLDLLLIAGLLSVWRQAFNYSVKNIAVPNKVLFVGDNKEINQIIEKINNFPQLGYQVAEKIKPEDIKTSFDVLEKTNKQGIKIIVTSLDPSHDQKLVQSLYQCLPLKVSFYDLPSFYEKVFGKVPLSNIGELWFLENLTEGQKNFYEAAKRVFDIIAALTLGIISLPFYPLIALIIKSDSRGSVFYTQKRIGLEGQIFTVIKFRTMTEAAEKDGVKWANHQDHRITKFGRFMRKTRIDELPQLLNILAGQMSFIGPRPERTEFVKQLEKEIPYYQVRHIIKPGLSGWAQVNFHYGASVEDSVEKLQYELYYIKHRSFILDLSIVLKTIKIVLKRGGR